MNHHISSMMTPGVIIVGMDDSLERVEALLRAHQISAVPVRDNASNAIVGIISSSDLLQLHAANRDPAKMRAWDICSYKPIEVSPDTSATEVARLMVTHGIHHVLVVEQRQIIGIVSALDFVKRYIADANAHP